MKLPPEIQRAFRRYGRTGGETRARRMTPAARRAVARLGGVARWTRARFGSPSFAALGMPGGEIVDAGLADLVSEEETVESLLVSLAAPRLRREGVPVPRQTHDAPESRLYRTLSETEGELAHARYLAYLQQVSSFADACPGARIDRDRDAK